LKEQEKQTGMVNFSSYVGRVTATVLTLALLLAAIAAWRWGRAAAYAVLFAAFLSVINMLILGGRLIALPASTQRAAQRLGGAVLQRWIITILGLIFAIFWLHLPVVGLVAGFLLTHFVFLAFLVRERSRQRS
jgi:ATP synthase I chain.